MSGTILVGVNGTDPSRAALRWAMKRAAAVGAKVSVAHVIDDGWATIGARMIGDLRDDAQRLVEKEAEYARRLTHDVVIHTQLLRGSLMQELIAASDSADMVVVGTHKTGFIHGKVFGSRSLWLAAAAHAPVAIIPQTSQRDGRGIVVGVDDSQAGRLAVRFAAIEAERARETLTLLRAFVAPDPTNKTDDVRRELTRHIEARTSATLSDASALVGSVAANVETRSRGIRRPAAEALVAASASAALLVIGCSRREDSHQVMVGSVSHDVLVNLTGPTVVVHAGDHQ